MAIKRDDEEFAATVYETTKADADRMMAEINRIATAHDVRGFIRRGVHDQSYSKLVECLAFYRVKEEKLYKTVVGTNGTWEGFCRSVNRSERTIDGYLLDLRGILAEFSADFAEIFQMPFSKIRFLGQMVSAGSAEIAEIEGEKTLIVGQVKIPLKPENKEALEDLIDELKQAQKAEIKAKQESIEAKDSELAAKSKLLEEKQKRISRLEEKMARLSADAEKSGYSSPDEEEYLKRAERDRIAFDGRLQAFAPESNMTALEGDTATGRTRAAYFANLRYIRDRILNLWDDVHTEYAGVNGSGEAADDWDFDAALSRTEAANGKES